MSPCPTTYGLYNTFMAYYKKDPEIYKKETEKAQDNIYLRGFDFYIENPDKLNTIKFDNEHPRDKYGNFRSKIK